MATWWRLHNSIRKSRKHMTCPPEVLRDWLIFTSIANEFDAKSGMLPDLQDIAWDLQITENKVKIRLERQVKFGLVEVTEDGYKIHEFDSWQYQNGDAPKQYSSAYKRLKKCRELKKLKESGEMITPMITPMITEMITPETLSPSRARVRSESESDPESSSEMMTKKKGNLGAVRQFPQKITETADDPALMKLVAENLTDYSGEKLGTPPVSVVRRIAKQLVRAGVSGQEYTDLMQEKYDADYQPKKWAWHIKVVENAIKEGDFNGHPKETH